MESKRNEVEHVPGEVKESHPNCSIFDGPT
jgi:hypothetical protein